MKKNQDPQWEAKLAAIVKSHKDGDLITHTEINGILGLVKPEFDEYEDAAAYDAAMQSYAFVRLSATEALKTDLLEQHQVYLDNVPGQGYRIVPPNEQTKLAYTKHTRAISKEFSDGMNAMNNVRQAALNAAERAEAVNVQAKFALLQELFERNKK